MTLFLRIFLSFWLAMLLLAGAFFLIQGIYGDERLDRAEAVLQAKAGTASVLWQEGGATAVEGWLRDAREQRRLTLVDHAGKPLAGRSLPAPLQEMLSGETKQGIRPLERGRVLLAARLPRLEPKLYLVTEMHRSRLGRTPFWMRAVATVLVFGLVSLALAHLLTRRLRPLRLAAQRMADGDLGVRVVQTGRDEIGALGADFNLMAERLSDLLQAQRRLVRDVSHELRSPLARLRIALELAQRSDDPGKAIKRIEKEAGELERLTTEVLSLARLEAGQAGFESRLLKLDELVARIVTDAEFEAQASARSIRFSPQPMQVVGDPVLLRSAVENVLRNAIRYTPEQGEVSVAMSHESGMAVVRVSDAGPGLEESQLQAVFDAFSRAADSRDRDSGGFGLGLAIARRAMRLHGGDVVARNRVEGGLEVVLHLPLSGTAVPKAARRHGQ